ncbi:MAG: uroporphyrinogen decarboxylase [Pseudohongiellaceae bacterium]|jgi:uroporphyrinogen decarboxylase
MSELKNDRIIRALLRQPVDITPVWMMRQAGRYLPEYREIRSKAGDFMTLCQNPTLACEVTLQPLRRFDLDAAILFSDILTVPDAMGLGLYFEQGEGPRFRKPVRTAKDVAALPLIKADADLSYVMDAVKLIRHELNGQVPLIGFSGSPWTIATYMVEGGASKDFSIIKRMLMATPELMHELLEKITLSVIDYLNAQIRAGVQVVQIFDTWGGVLSPHAYQKFSLHYMHKILQGLLREHDGRRVPVIVFTKNGGLWLEKIASIGSDCVGLDWTINISEARTRIGSQVSLQGNMDPSVLYAAPARIREEVSMILQQFGSGNGHVFNLGHGIHQHVDIDHVSAFIDAVHELSAQFH